MATEIPRVIESTADIPEPLRAALADAYVPAPADSPLAGKLVLAGANKDVEAVQGALINERQVSSARQAQLTTLKGELEALKATPPPAPAKTGKAKDSDGDPLMNPEVQKRLNEVDAKYKDLISSLESRVNEQTQKAAEAEAAESLTRHHKNLEDHASRAGAAKASTKIVRMLMEERIKEIDGQRVVVDAQGKLRLGQTKNLHAPMGFDELAAEILNENKNLLAGATVGSGAAGGANANGQGANVTISEADSKNPKIWRDRMAEASKRGVELVIV